MSTQSSRSRRDFLQKFTSVVGGTTAMAATAGMVHAAPVAKQPEKVEEKPVAKGYQRTEHVDTYYHLADF